MPATPEELFTDMSRRSTDLVVDMILQKPELFEEIFALYLRNVEPVSRRAAWAVDLASEQCPELLEGHFTAMIEKLATFSHDGLKRHTLRMLARSPLPQGDQLGILMNSCFDWLLSPREAIATKACCMDILYRISQIEPDLKKELADSIEWRMEEESSGFKNRGRKLLRKLYAEMRGA